MLSPSHQPAERATDRVVTDLDIGIQLNGQLANAVMYNLSAGGCMLECDCTIPFQGDRLNLLLADRQAIRGTIAWQVEHFCGVSFDDLLDTAIVLSLGFQEPGDRFAESLPRDRFGRLLPVLSGRLPF